MCTDNSINNTASTSMAMEPTPGRIPHGAHLQRGVPRKYHSEMNPRSTTIGRVVVAVAQIVCYSENKSTADGPTMPTNFKSWVHRTGTENRPRCETSFRPGFIRIYPEEPMSQNRLLRVQRRTPKDIRRTRKHPRL